MTLDLQVARVLHGTTAEGPGNRTAIWVQGCSIRCHGCINPQLFSVEGGAAHNIQKLVDDAVAAEVEGITLLGGEPFDQPEAVAILAESAHRAGLGVICFTGYDHDNLVTNAGSAVRLLAAVDLLVDGPYDSDLPENERSLVGSTNQRFIHLTDRYRGFHPDQHPNRVDVRILPDGSIHMAGFLLAADVVEIASAVGATRQRSNRRLMRRDA